MGINYGETFSSTADLMSVSVVLQKAAQENLLLHQIDLKTAYWHTHIDYEIYINPPQGYKEKEGIVSLYEKIKFVKFTEKSLCGLKQSWRNWNRVLHDCLTEDGFTQNPANHCVYAKESEGDHNHIGR